MSSVSDYQRSKVYAAEDAAFDKRKPPAIPALHEVRAYMDMVIASQHWTKHKGWQRVRLEDGRGRRSACYRSHKRSIAMPTWARSEWIVIHEMAHCLTHRTTGAASSHGTHFTWHYLMLVLELLGQEAHDALAEQFIGKGVKWHNLG